MAKGRKVRWGILGPGTIARTFAGGVAHSKRGRLVALGARDPGRPEYAEHFPGARVLAGYEALLADPEVEAVYIATPHPQPRRVGDQGGRGRQARAGARSRSRLTACEADAMFHAARRAGTFMGEAFMYRLHPQTARLARADPGRRDRRGADDQVELRLRHAGASTRRTGSTPTTSPAAASSTSAATRCRWRG